MRFFRTRFGKNAISVLITVLILYVFLCYSLANTYLHPSVASSGLPPKGLRDESMIINGEKVRIWSNDFARAKNVLVLVHGYGGNQNHWKLLSRELAIDGFGVVVPAMPGHEEANTETGFGVKEGRRVAGLVDLVRSKSKIKNQKIVVLGVSMGGAASWLAVDRGAKVDGVITEGAYARFDEAMQQWFEAKLPGASFLLKPVVWIASFKSGIDPSKVNPIEGAEKWRGKPALIIQAGNDDLILRSHADRLG